MAPGSASWPALACPPAPLLTLCFRLCSFCLVSLCVLSLRICRPASGDPQARGPPVTQSRCSVAAENGAAVTYWLWLHSASDLASLSLGFSVCAWEGIMILPVASLCTVPLGRQELHAGAGST